MFSLFNRIEGLLAFGPAWILKVKTLNQSNEFKINGKLFWVGVTDSVFVFGQIYGCPQTFVHGSDDDDFHL